MPFDSTGFLTETKPDVFSLEGLIAWLETQNPETEYDWTDCRGHCLLGQYLTAHGRPQGDYTRLSRVLVPISETWGPFRPPGCPDGTMHLAHIVCEMPHTFGDALGRARKLLEARS